MRRRFRRPGHATVVAYLALFVALGGTAAAAVVVSSNSEIAPNTIYGANKPAGANDNIVDGSVAAADLKGNSVRSDRITDNSVASIDIADGSLTGADIADGSVNGNKLIKNTVPGPKIANDSLTGGQIDESTLGQVPNAANAGSLGGLGAGSFVHGSGRIETIDASIRSGDSGTVLDLPGFITLYFFCEGAATEGQYSIGTGPNSINALWDNGAPDPGHMSLSANSAIGSSFWKTTPAGDSYVWSFDGAGKVATVILFNSTFTNPFTHEVFCNVQGHAVVHEP
jgi:hypothetical protein